jgi:glycopeptide antibiotics resistance protein
LDQKILSTDWESLEFKLQSVQDIFFNFVGFMPLGFILAANLMKAGSDYRINIILMPVLLCFAVSLMIEISQAWIPSRSSDSLDLMLNTIGGFAGALICYQVIGKRLHNS